MTHKIKLSEDEKYTIIIPDDIMIGLVNISLKMNLTVNKSIINMLVRGIELAEVERYGGEVLIYLNGEYTKVTVS